MGEAVLDPRVPPRPALGGTSSAAQERDARRMLRARITQAELGEPGCGVWSVRPRLGLIGMLAGWWQVKLSSGCP